MAYYEIIGMLEVMDEEYPTQGLIVPVFSTDSEIWERIKNAQCSMLVVVKPDEDGNNSAISSYLQEIVDKTALIYIDSQDAERALDDLLTEIDNWINNDKIKGFFVSNVNKDNYEYYQQISFHLLNSGKKLVLCSNSQIDDKFFNIADIIVFENNASTFNDGLCSNENADKKGVIIYDVDSFQKPSCKYFYFTDLKYPDQYSGLSQFFDEMVDSVSYY